MKILLLGLDNAGKTTILKAVSNESFIKFTFWDLGGQESIRHVWENYFEGNDAIVN